MIIHVIQPGDTISSIASQYGISEERLMLENEVTDNSELVIGEALVILFPALVYTVREGDSLSKIAASYNTTVIELLRNNPYLSDREYIYPGEEIVISFMDTKTYTMSTNGFAYPFIDISVLKKTLPFLTELTIFHYRITTDCKLIDINDEDVIRTAKSYGVATYMLVTPLSDSGSESMEVVQRMLTDEACQDQLIQNILVILKEKEYYGFNIYTPGLLPGEQQPYIDFVAKLTPVLNAEGYPVLVTFSPSGIELQTGTVVSEQFYTKISKVVNGVRLLDYNFGYTTKTPLADRPYETISSLLGVIVTLIPPEKISLGISSVGYVWELPYVEGESRAYSISSSSVIKLAATVGAVIRFDEVSKQAYFYYGEHNQYLVRFGDARSIDALLKLVPQYGLNGAGLWSIMSYFPQMWLVINSQYEIASVLTVWHLD